MSTALPFLLAVALQFHGVIGQSASKGEEQLAFTGVRSIIELPGERVLFIGDDGRLYEIVDGRIRFTGRMVKGDFLDFDGIALRSLGRCSGVWEIDLETLEPRRTVVAGGVRWDIAGVRPDGAEHPFAGRCKYVTWDPLGDRMVAYDSCGRDMGTLMEIPSRKESSRVEGFGFLSGIGDLLMVTYWPDVRILRFRPDGSQVVGNGWPISRGFGYLRTSGGKTFHCGTSSIMPIADNMTYPKEMKVGHESILTGYAKQGGREFIGTSQGLYVKERGETSYNRRLGGIGRLTALAVGGGFVFMSMGEKIRWMYLDGDGFEPFQSPDSLVMRIDNGRNWKDRIVDMVSGGDGWLKVAAGNAGRWRFRMTPPLDYANHRIQWILESEKPCVTVQTENLPAKLRPLLASADVPSGLEAGKIATDGRWVIVEDFLNHRLLRFRLIVDPCEKVAQ